MTQQDAHGSGRPSPLDMPTTRSASPAVQSESVTAAPADRVGPSGPRRMRAIHGYAFMGVNRSAADRRAGLGNPDAYDQLAGLADPEDWDGAGPSARGTLRLLRNYIEWTFERLHQEGKVLASSDGRMSAFNTGLATRHQETIYGLLTRNRGLGNEPWRFEAWREESHVQLLQNFPQLPDFARYTDDPADLFYDWRLGDPVVNVKHIVSETENLSRFPEPLRSHSYQAELALEGALKRALKRVRRNYRTAVPFWYPTLDKVQLLLPLSLNDPDVVDLALVVARIGDYYRGNTVLTTAMAYANARLLTRPDSDWLLPVAPVEGVDAEAVVAADSEPIAAPQAVAGPSA